MLKIDLHIHSIHSGHAYGTFYDIIAEAKKKKMKMIAITDHGPGLDGSACNFHFGMGFRAPYTDDPKVLWGCEANIIDENGGLDIDTKQQKKLDILLANIHIATPYKDLGRIRNTSTIMNTMKNPRLAVLVHPANPFFDIDFIKIVDCAVANDVLLEINLSYLKHYGDDRSIDAYKAMIEHVKKKGKKVILNSDAHFLHEIGDDSILDRYRERLGLTDDLIINNYPDELMEFIEKKKVR